MIMTTGPIKCYYDSVTFLFRLKHFFNAFYDMTPNLKNIKISTVFIFFPIWN